MLGYAFLALAGAAAAMPQAVTSAIAPQASAPAGCSANYPGTFQIAVVNVTNKAAKRDAVTISLKNGVMTDSQGRTGYIASNRQFQFDGPVQAGAIYTAGWSVCGNTSVALGGSTIFYQCLSGTFYNLYDRSQGAQCSPIYIEAISAGGASAGAATQVTDGQVQATTSTSRAVSQISDGQIQATTGTARPVTQISDGQIQATTGTSRAVVSQISDGQIQATTGTSRPASSTSRAVVSQISDGQIQATTGTSRAVVTQISDGQIQATTGTSRPASSSSRAVVSQISDGQIQAATNGTSRATATPTVAQFTGGASLPTMRAELFGLAAGVLAVAML